MENRRIYVLAIVLALMLALMVLGRCFGAPQG